MTLLFYICLISEEFRLSTQDVYLRHAVGLGWELEVEYNGWTYMEMVFRLRIGFENGMEWNKTLGFSGPSGRD